MKLEDMLSKISQSPQEKYCKSSFIWGIFLNIKYTENEKVFTRDVRKCGDVVKGSKMADIDDE
jgi:hypothetical protein